MTYRGANSHKKPIKVKGGVGKMTSYPHFVDHYVHKVDSKNRVSIPAEMRIDLGNECYVTLGDEKNCLSVFTLLGWDEFNEFLETLPHKLRAKAKLHYSAYAKRITLDPNGRITLTDKFRKIIGTEAGEELVLYGSGDRIQIWNKDAFFAKLDEGDDIDWAEEFENASLRS